MSEKADEAAPKLVCDEAPKLICDEAPKLSCGFCRRGVEAKDVCGKLWNDREKGCTAHQRCMQYSAGLAQYTMKRFGGFKVARVLKEQSRGKWLKCCICSNTKMKKKSSSCGGATAGCAWHKCRKTFHFYCARKNIGPVACKMVETRENGEKIDHYCVFCTEEHKLLFTKNLKNPVHNELDTDDEAYVTDISSSDESDGSEESSVESLGKSEAVQNRPRLISSESHDSCEKSGDEHANKNNVARVEKLDTKKNTGVDSDGDIEKNVDAASMKRKSNGDGDVVKTKRPKVESSSTDDDSGNATSEFVICFVEQAERVNGPVKEALERAACTRFNLPPASVFVWQYNGQRLSNEHFVYLLNEIGKALVNGDHATVSRLVFKMQLSDIAEFDKKIAHNSTLDVDARRALYRGIRQQIARNFKKATEQSSRRVCSYCRIKSDEYDEEVAFVLITKELISYQESVEETSDEEELMTNDAAKNAKVKDTESSRLRDNCDTGRIQKKTLAKSGEILGSKSNGDRTNKVDRNSLAEVADGEQSCKVKRSDDRKHLGEVKIKSDHVKDKVQKKMKDNIDSKDQNEDAIIRGHKNEKGHKKHGVPSEKFLEKKKENHERKNDKEKALKIDSLNENEKKICHTKDNAEKKFVKKKIHQVKEKGSGVSVVRTEKESSRLVDKEKNGDVSMEKTVMKEFQEDTTRENGLIVDKKKNGDVSMEKTVMKEFQEDTTRENRLSNCSKPVEATKTDLSEHVDSTHPSNISENIPQKEDSVSSIGQVCETVKVQSLYVWNEKVSLICNVNKSNAEMMENHKTELSRIKEYLMSRIDARTTLRRYPAGNDIPLLSPEVPPPFSVTSRLVDFFVPVSREDSLCSYANSRTTKPGRRIVKGKRNHSSTQISDVFNINSDEKIIGSASSIVFLGPFDPNVIRHDEYVRRRITAVFDSTPSDVGDVCCVTDVGQDVRLTRISDIIGATRLRPGTSIRVLTGVDPQFNPVTVVLLLISESLV